MMNRKVAQAIAVVVLVYAGMLFHRPSFCMCIFMCGKGGCEKKILAAVFCAGTIGSPPAGRDA